MIPAICLMFVGMVLIAIVLICAINYPPESRTEHAIVWVLILIGLGAVACGEIMAANYWLVNI